jgi:LIM domain kinase 2
MGCAQTSIQPPQISGADPETEEGRIKQAIFAARKDVGHQTGLFGLTSEDIVVGEKLGMGCFGSVMSGTWRGFPVALKFLTEESLELLRKECALLNTLHHENVLIIYGICEGTAPDSWPEGMKPPCMCCEIMPKGTLLDFLKNQTRDNMKVATYWAQLCGMLIGAASGLAFLHSAMVMHRDFKSENLMLDSELRIKLVDFGLAKKGEEALGVTPMNKTNTCSVGAWTHMAPEVRAGPDYDTFADVFAFGIVISEVIAANSAEEIVDETRNGEFGLDKKGLLKLIDPTFPTGCATLVDIAEECCVMDASKRPTMDAVRTKLIAARESFQGGNVATE